MFPIEMDLFWTQFWQARYRRHPSILVIDDQDDQARLTAAILRRAHCDVKVATSAKEGIRAIAESTEPFDLVLLDIMMPDRSGIAVMNFLKRWRPVTGAPAVVIHTSLLGWREKLTGAGYAFDDYIDKPISPTALIDRVEMALHPREHGACS
jgi:DNA-binding response OmpR family regulator